MIHHLYSCVRTAAMFGCVCANLPRDGGDSIHALFLPVAVCVWGGGGYHIKEEGLHGPACVCGGGGYCHFYQVSRISPYGHSGVLGSGHSHRSRPTVRAQGASLWYPSTSVICTLDQNLARCPETTLEVRVVAPWLPPGQLHGNSSTSPSWPCCPVCCVCDGAITAGGARGSEAASMPTHSATFPERVPWTHGFQSLARHAPSSRP